MLQRRVALIVESGDHTKHEKSAEDDMREEMEMLNKDLEEALANKDYDGADRLQTLIDEIAAKLEGGADSFARLPSAFEDQTTFSITVEVLSCSGLVTPSKKAPVVSPYVSEQPCSICLLILYCCHDSFDVEK